MSTSREDVYKAIDSERAYQLERWTPDTTVSGGLHSFEEWIVYIEHYLGLAKAVLSTKAAQEAQPAAAEIMRKVTALGVACMEQHGAPLRGGGGR